MASVDGRRNTDVPSEGEMKQCGPCQLSGLVEEADIFCRQCDDYMCASCATIHTRFKLSRNHSVVPCSGLHSPARRDARRLPLTFCDDHQDRAIQWFCIKHNLMFCDNCKSTIHRKCQVTSISDQAAGHGQLAPAVESMTALKSRIANLKIARENSVEDLEKLQKSFEVDVEQFKSDIIELVDRLGREMLAEMKKVVSSEMDVILGHVKACQVLIPKVETDLMTADEARTAADDVTSVIAAHKLAKARNSLEPTVSDMEQEVYMVNVRFLSSRTLADVVTGVDRLGTVDIDRTATGGVDPPMSASRPVRPASIRTSFVDMAVASSADINVPAGWISGSTITPDGRIVLVHRGKKQIILLDNNLTIQSSLTLQGDPWDLAADGDNDVIVSMGNSKQLQWIHVDGALRAGRTITTSHPCYCVAVHNGQIFISVIRGSTGHVQVLNRDGGVVRRIGAASLYAHAHKFTLPYYITVGAPGTLYLADCTDVGRITCFTSAGDRVYDVTHNGMRLPLGMVADHDGNLLVCCKGSNDVHVLAKDGSHNRILLTSADGVAGPYSMAYRRSDGTLIVTMDTKPYCRAYKLK